MYPPSGSKSRCKCLENAIQELRIGFLWNPFVGLGSHEYDTGVRKLTRVVGAHVEGNTIH